MILVLGGTTEAKQLLELLIADGQHVTISTAYGFAEKFMPKSRFVKHISGKLGLEELQALIKEQDIRVVVDATHPYAIEISANAQKACDNLGVSYIRLERDSYANNGDESDDVGVPDSGSDADHTGLTDRCNEVDVRRAHHEGNHHNGNNTCHVHYVCSNEEAAGLSKELGRAIFLATGSNAAGYFRRELGQDSRKLYIRVLPEDHSIIKCVEAGFAEDEIITGVGPFSYEENYNLWRSLDIDAVITKDSGSAGGFIEKLNAAKDLGIHIVIIKRPIPEGQTFKTADEVIQTLHRF